MGTVAAGVREDLTIDFGMTLTPYATYSVIAISGELDLATSPSLEALTGAVYGPVVFDLRQCQFLDSTGLRIIVHQRQRGPVSIARQPGTVVARALDLTYRDTIFCAATLRDAIAAVERRADR